MTIVAKIGIFGMIGVLLAIQFRSRKPEFGMYIALGISILIFTFCIGQAGRLIGYVQQLEHILGSGAGYMGVLLKVIGITYICEFSAGICKDAGYGSIADQIEILGKLSVIFAGMPILFGVIEKLQGFI